MNRAPERHRQLTGAEVRLDEIPLHSSSLLTLLDRNGIVRYESPSIERIFGFDQRALIGEQVLDYIHPDDLEAVADAFDAVVSGQGNSVEAIEFRHERADGSYGWVESTASTEPTPSGLYVVNTRDVSAQRARERALRETNARLESFSSIVSHDLRNPLAIAKGRLDLAMAESNSEHLEEIDRALSRMDTLINDMLAVAREGEAAISPEPVNLHALVTDCWATVETDDATLRNEAEATIVADRDRLRQVLENLLRNAVEHGGQAVTVRAGVFDDGWFVEDDGAGIPDDELPVAMEAGHTTGTNGAGLGLNIVEGIAEVHGWKPRIESRSGGGTRIEISGVTFADG